jgi:hypothetical protein
LNLKNNVEPTPNERRRSLLTTLQSKRKNHVKRNLQLLKPVKFPLKYNHSVLMPVLKKVQKVVVVGVEVHHPMKTLGLVVLTMVHVIILGSYCVQTRKETGKGLMSFVKLIFVRCMKVLVVWREVVPSIRLTIVRPLEERIKVKIPTATPIRVQRPEHVAWKKLVLLKPKRVALERMREMILTATQTRVDVPMDTMF